MARLSPRRKAAVAAVVVVLAVFLCALLMTSGIRRARLGRLLRALGDSPRALQAQGISLNVTKVAVFAIAAFLAGVGGALLVSQNQFLTDGPFDPVNSLTVVVVVLILRMGQPLTSLLAAGAYVVVPSYLGAHGQIWWLDLGFGAAAVLSAVMGSFRWIPRLQWAARPVPRRVATRRVVTVTMRRASGSLTRAFPLTPAMVAAGIFTLHDLPLQLARFVVGDGIGVLSAFPALAIGLEWLAGDRDKFDPHVETWEFYTALGCTIASVFSEPGTATPP